MQQKKLIWTSVLTLILLVVSLSIVQAQVTTYDLSYDEIGNLQQSFDQYLEYNEFNRLIRVRENDQNGQILEEYTYDQEGNRLTKYEALINQTTYYVSKDFIEVHNSTGKSLSVYYHDELTLIGREDPSGDKSFYHPDHLGSTDLVTNSSGDIVEETTYKPYGEVIDGGESKFLYNSKELDMNTGMYYYEARYYDPLFRYFTQPDENIPEIYNPSDLNRYIYVRNNPYKYVDPTGEVALQIGAEASAGLGGFFGIGSVGVVLVYGDRGFQHGYYKSSGVGATTGGTFGAGAEFILTPSAQNPQDVRGETFDISFGGGELVHLSGGTSLSKKSSDNIQQGYIFNPGFGGELTGVAGSVSRRNTEIFRERDFTRLITQMDRIVANRAIKEIASQKEGMEAFGSFVNSLNDKFRKGATHIRKEGAEPQKFGSRSKEE